jgi:hypothetical protein
MAGHPTGGDGLFVGAELLGGQDWVLGAIRIGEQGRGAAVHNRHQVVVEPLE